MQRRAFLRNSATIAAAVLFALGTLLPHSSVVAAHRLAVQGKDKLGIVDQSGDIEWEYEVPRFRKARKPGHGPEAFGNKVFGAVRLRNGNLLIEVEPKSKKVIWTFDQFQTFGNSVPNSQLLDVDGDVIR